MVDVANSLKVVVVAVLERHAWDPVDERPMVKNFRICSVMVTVVEAGKDVEEVYSIV